MNDEPTSNMHNLHYDAKGHLQKGNKSRVEVIKERFNLWKESGPFDAEELYEAVVDNSTDDIQYLLSKLEIAEKVLEGVANTTPQNHYCEWANSKRKEASEALKQLRE